MPKVSVLIPVYNGERYLRQAMDSVLSQTFGDFELIIVDDGSQDSTPDILAQEQDDRLRVLRHTQNRGQTISLNAGLAVARGQYIARLDADDVALPSRLEKQVAFLDQHPEVGLLGSGYQTITSDDQQAGARSLPANDLTIRWTSLLANPFIHPTMMLRREVLTHDGLSYDETFHIAQDYDFWVRMLRCTRGANLSEPLTQYRVHAASLSATQATVMFREHDTIALRTIQEQLPGFVITREQVGQLRALFIGGRKFAPSFDTQRVPLVNLYLDMLESFESHCSGEPGWGATRREAAWKVARFVLEFPLELGWVRVVRRLIAIDPGFPRSFWRRGAEAVGRRLGRGTSGALS